SLSKRRPPRRVGGAASKGRELRGGIGPDDPERRALRIAEDGETTHLRDVHRVHERGAAELLRLRGRRVRVLDRDVRLPVRRDARVRERNESRDAGLASVGGPVTADVGYNCASRPDVELYDTIM